MSETKPRLSHAAIDLLLGIVESPSMSIAGAVLVPRHSDYDSFKMSG